MAEASELGLRTVKRVASELYEEGLRKTPLYSIPFPHPESLGFLLPCTRVESIAALGQSGGRCRARVGGSIRKSEYQRVLDSCGYCECRADTLWCNGIEL